MTLKMDNLDKSSNHPNQIQKQHFKTFVCYFLCSFHHHLFYNILYGYLVTPQAKRAIFISLTSLTLSFASGTVIILCYVTDIFAKSGSSLPTKHSSLLVSITQITANLIFLNTVERINRRVCIKSCLITFK